MKPATPILRNEHYLDVMTGGSASLPSPILREERYLAKLAGMEVDIPNPVTIKEKYYAKICGMDVDVPTYTRNMPRIYAYMAKAAGQTIEELPTAVTREQRYWYDYVSEQPVTEHEYTGAVPYTFTANGEPLVDWSVYGNTVQSTTPTHDNPVMPNGCGDMTGNLFDVPDSSATVNALKTLVDFGTDVTFDTITCSCMFDNIEAEGSYGAFIDYLMDNGTHQYVPLSGMRNVNDDTRFSTNVKVNGNYYNTTQNITFRKIQVYLYTTGYNKFKSGNIKWAFYNSDKKDYEPYGYKLTISSASTTTPVYLGEVQTVRKVKKAVFNGTESWIYESAYSCFYTTISGFVSLGIRLTPFLSNAFGSISDGRPIADVPDNTVYSGDGNKVYIKCTSYTSAADFKTYLQQQYAAGTPVTIWYVLSSATTGIVNEPLMKIGDYADEVSNVATIPTNNGSTTIDVDTTVKPSEVYIKWKGV